MNPNHTSRRAQSLNTGAETRPLETREPCYRNERSLAVPARGQSAQSAQGLEPLDARHRADPAVGVADRHIRPDVRRFQQGEVHLVWFAPLFADTG
jgi:hypothetical protein